MKEIFEKDTLTKLLIFSYIESSEKHSFSISDIEKELDLSYFKANKLMNELIDDLALMGLDDFFYISKNKSRYIYKKNGLDSINRLIWMYGRNTYIFQLLDFILRTEDQQKETLEEFSYEYHVSLSFAYVIKSKLEDFLNIYHINFLSSSFVESKLRIFLSQLYFYVFKNYEIPFSKELFDKSLTFVDLLIDSGIIKNVSLLQKQRIIYYCLVSFFRIQGRNKSTENVLADPIDEKLLDLILGIYYQHGGKLENIEESDIISLINYLRLNNYLEENDTSTIMTDFETTLVNKFITETLADIALSDFDLVKKVNNVFKKYSFYKDSIIDGNFYTSLKVFEEQYDSLLNKIIYYLSEETVKSYLGQQFENKSLILELLLIIVNSTGFEKMSMTINITVDFSLGQEYNDFIKSNVEQLPFINLNVDNFYSENTDLYLSDVLSDAISSEYIIWNSPPSSRDWEIFGNLISELREKKMAYV